ncbi:MAG: pantoate--beta-alanine ligase [Myxococcales bacterium]|nr:pantoate--beta-alanine ligase [Myxococcales bacterium]
MTTARLPCLASTAAELRVFVQGEHRAGRRVALVPTMGALHRGHMALVEAGHRSADAVVVSIFVNPLQFGASEDLDRYPRTLPADLELCGAHGVACVFAPSATEMYPEGCATRVQPGPVADRWCGAARPGHFTGVATVVLKLLNLAGADVALFGEKDWQQFQVIRSLARDLDHPTRIEGVPIVRDPDGLALSSRNRYLSAEDRRAALVISRALHAAQAASLRDAAKLEAAIVASIAAAGGRIDYVGIVEAATLEPVAVVARPARALVAAWFGPARLLDNIALNPPTDESVCGEGACERGFSP